MTLDQGQSAKAGVQAASVEIKALPHALGAQILCGDVRKLDAESARRVREAWLAHLY